MAKPDNSGGPLGLLVTMPFIVSSNIEKVDPTTRKLIRSHVMRGKKKRRRRHTECYQPRTDWDKISLGNKAALIKVELESVFKMYTPPLLRTVATDLSSVKFPDEVEPSLLFNVTKVSTVAMKVMFPLVMAVAYEADNKEWLYLVGVDAAALHITIFAIESFIDRILHHQESNSNTAAMLHLQKGLSLLRERFLGLDAKMKISNSTIGAVVKLASAAHFDGDYQASKQHMEGLRKIVELRGGLDVFSGTQLLVDMLRCDLGIALLNGSEHVFYSQPSDLAPEYPEKLLEAPDEIMRSADSLDLIRDMDSKLATAWQMIRRFCWLVNLASQTQRSMRPDIIYDTMTAVIYRLLQMTFRIDSIDEAIRLGLLAYCYHVFLQWQDIKPVHQHFPNTFRRCILSFKLGDGISSNLRLWLLMTGANSVFRISDEAWLRHCLSAQAEICGIRTWRHMQEVLKSFMWIALLDEGPGKYVYDLVN